MDIIIDSLKTYDNVTILGVILFLSSIISCVSRLLNVLGSLLNKYYRKRKGLEDKNNSFENTLNRHQSDIETLKQYETETHNDIKEIKTLLEFKGITNAPSLPSAPHFTGSTWNLRSRNTSPRKA